MRRWSRRLVLAAALTAWPALAQSPAMPVSAPALPGVAIETNAGTITVEVDTQHAPISAGNFLRYVDQHRLDGASFYRVVKVQDHFGFVQFGTNNDPKRVLPPIKHEPTSLTGLKHLDFTLSTARLAPGSARGEFTITVGAQPGFDADPSRPGDNLGYAAFGHVVDGTDVVLKIFDAPNSPTKTLRGAFQGNVPETPVTIIRARRIATP